MLDVRITAQLIEAARSGEEVAWNALHRRYYPGLYSIALRLCKNNDEAKDILQDTFITAYLKLSQLKDTASFAGWIKTILIHACYRVSRQNQKKRLDTIRIENDCWWEDEINNKFDWLSTKSKLYTTLTLLPEALRTTLLLRYFSDFQSYENISDILSIPVGTVRSRLSQAKIILAEKWQRHGDTGANIFNEGEEWNKFYYATFSGIHHFDDCKKRFINHLQKDMQIILPGGKTNIGRHFFENKIYDDLEFGSWCKAANVISSGNISIIETNHFNSAEHPDHCPLSSVVVLYRNKGVAAKMNLHVPTK